MNDTPLQETSAPFAPQGEALPAYSRPVRRVASSLLIFGGLLLLALALGFNGWMIWRQQNVVSGAEGPVQSRALQRADDAEMAAFQQVFQLLKQQYVTEPDTTVLIQGAIDGMVAALDDPRSHYFSPEQMQMQTERSSGSYTGIGSTVESRDGYVTLVNVYAGSPAEKAGLKNGDQLLTIDGVDAKGMLLDDAVARVKGVRGTKVALLIQRPGVLEPFEVEVVRDLVETVSVVGKMLEDQVGLIQISSFANTTGVQFSKELNTLREGGMKGLILDLRNNGGGTLEGLMDVANLLVPEGVVFTWVFRGDETENEYSTLKVRDFEVVVLMNGYSASASEVLAGALQDTDAAKLIGTRSFGKGSAQYTFNLINKGGISLTASKWLTPKGRHIEGQGLEPDLKVLDPYDPLIVERDQPIKPGQIELLQVKLQALGYNAPFEEKIGERTVEAIKEFQRSNLIYVSGALSDDTVQVLNKLCYEQIPHDSDPQMEVALKEIKNMIAR